MSTMGERAHDDGQHEVSQTGYLPSEMPARQDFPTTRSTPHTPSWEVFPSPASELASGMLATSSESSKAHPRIVASRTWPSRHWE